MNINIDNTPCQALLHPGAPCPSAQLNGTESQDERSDSFLYLNSNNCTGVQKSLSKFTPYQRKNAYRLEKDVDKFVSQVGINNILFLTLTFAQNIVDNKEASKRFHSLRTHFISKFFGKWMLVKERQKRGAWHYHILVEVPFDVRSSFDFDTYRFIGILRKENVPWSKKGKFIKKFERKLHRSASPGLRSVWALLTENMKKYGFGRSHAAPIETNVEAISKYVGKYISKHMDERITEDKGVRLTSTSKDFINSSTKFAWNTEGGKEWRRKLKQFASLIGIRNMADMAYVFGSKWAYHWEHSILSVDTITPSEILRFQKLVKKKRAGLNKNKMFVMGNGQLMDSTTGEVLF